MHMADALLSPAVGGLMWAASGAALVIAARRVQDHDDARLTPLMGVLGAFVFAAQMINFAIPGTGSSGHLGGGLLLAILLGPAPAFVVIASVLTVQALFFADGGLLALGANLFNLGLLPCYLAYPLVYRPLARGTPSPARLTFACVAAAVVGLQLGALGVVLQTVGSAVTSLDFSTFLWLMLPIHLAIGVVEGLATAALVLFIRRARPDLLASSATPRRAFAPVLAGFTAAALVTGGLLAWFASADPDGLEWSLARAAHAGELTAPASPVHATLAQAQQRLAVLPDYDLPGAREPAPGVAAAWARPGTSLAGVVGAALTLLLVLLTAWVVRRQRGRQQ
jgi:cobalt/nickel transport system permease protein